jgi:transposase
MSTEEITSQKTAVESPPSTPRRGARRRTYSVQEKLQFLAEAESVGESLSSVSRKHGVAMSALFRWRQLRDTGSMTSVKTGEAVVPASEVAELKAQIKRLQKLVGEKEEDLAVLKDAVELMREKKLLSPAALSKLEGIL